ncbi:MAG: hypothetical protein ACWGSQ_09985, partial [Longimicrobiales bacterium]
SYLLGTLAHEAGKDSLAVRFFSRLDSLVYGIDTRDTGWGLLALSYFFRAVSYDAMEDDDRAADFFIRFVEAWPEPDMDESLTREARRRLEQLSK